MTVIHIDVKGLTRRSGSRRHLDSSHHAVTFGWSPTRKLFIANPLPRVRSIYFSIANGTDFVIL